MTDRSNRRPLRTGGHQWGPRRVRLGVSLRDLARRSGLNRGDLSRMERGRMVPTGEEFDRVMAALEAVESGAAVGSGSPTPSGAAPD